jgi:hypothetical protein
MAAAAGNGYSNHSQKITPSDTVGIRLAMTGERDKSGGTDYIGDGKNYFFSAADGDWTATAFDNNSGGIIDTVYFSFSGKHGGQFDGETWSLYFSSANLTGPPQLVPGTYNNAQQLSGAPGHPGLNVSGDSRGCNTLSGSFTVYNATFDTSVQPPRVASFAATFEQHCEEAALALKGTIFYNSSVPASSNPPVITNVSYSSRKGKLVIEGSGFDASDVVVVDGETLSLSSDSSVKIGGLIKIKGARIPGGAHQVQVANYTGAISAAFTLLV